MSRRLLAAAALAAAALATTAPTQASAYVCVAYVGDICVGPCGLANEAHRRVTGNDLLYC